MQGTPAYRTNLRLPLNQKTFVTLLVLILFLLLGAAVGYLAAQAGLRQATLNVQVENDTGVSQDFRIYLNDDQVATLFVANGATATLPLQIGWTSGANALVEVRADPTVTGGSDQDTRTVSNGQTVAIPLRVR